MVQKTTELKEQKEEPLLYTDSEVGNIISLLGTIYALDDAIYNQKQLQRPVTNIQPLEELRRGLGMQLQAVSAKQAKITEKKEPASQPG